MKIGLIAILGILMLSLFMTGCNSNASSENMTGNAVSNLEADERTINIDKLEIYHFHGTNQCYSCITVGDYAEATVNTYFKEELENGIIVFDHINGELPENKELVIKYGATGSSLWLGTYSGEDFSAEQNTNVWYKIQDKTTYMNYLKEVIEKKLAGN
ncbi:MAG: nitrophenyl compound nitroreductase subunit ArsF family protein [Candidatus Woesearchaeota archaeon]